MSMRPIINEKISRSVLEGAGVRLDRALSNLTPAPSRTDLEIFSFIIGLIDMKFPQKSIN